MKATKRLKLTALQRAAQFCGAAYELESFEPQWKRLIDLLADWCDEHKSEIVWASLGLYGNGEETRLTFYVGFEPSLKDLDDRTYHIDINTARDGRLDMISLNVLAFSGPVTDALRDHPGELHRFLG